MNRTIKSNFSASLCKGSICPKPEDVLPGWVYTFTLSPANQPSINGLTTFQDWWSSIYDACCEFQGSYIKMWCELSRMGRFHFHGFITIHDPLNFYLKDVHKLDNIGHFEIDTIDGFDGNAIWYAYCIKQQIMMKPFLHRELFSMLCQEEEDFYYIDTHSVSQ